MSVDLSRLAEAMRASGWTVDDLSCELAFTKDRVYLRWEGDGDHAELAFAMRDEVRKIAPGSYCIPIPIDQQKEHGPMRVVFRNELGSGMRKVGTWVRHAGVFGDTETECWAKALIALHEAGLLGVTV